MHAPPRYSLQYCPIPIVDLDSTEFQDNVSGRQQTVRMDQCLTLEPPSRSQIWMEWRTQTIAYRCHILSQNLAQSRRQLSINTYRKALILIINRGFVPSIWGWWRFGDAYLTYTSTVVKKSSTSSSGGLIKIFVIKVPLPNFTRQIGTFQ
jgi:hypothetical protein